MSGSIEITSLAGNIYQMDGEVYVHVHITLADETYQAYGGHLNEAWIEPTAVITIEVIDGQIGYEFDEETGLNLITF